MDKKPYITPREDEGLHIEKKTFVISADLGQANDYTAISIIEKTVHGVGVFDDVKLHLRHIERERGVPYPDIVDRLMTLYKSPTLKGVEKVVVIDYTGLGRPFYDMMRVAGFKRSLNAISITGGNNPDYQGVHWNVPKRDLVTNLQILLQNETLRIAKGLKEANTLIEEMANFQTKINAAGHDIYNGRSGVHDDIVMSVAMGAWMANRKRLRGGTDEVL